MTTSALEASARLADLLRREHLAMAGFLVALGRFDAEQGWVALGHASLFDYLHRCLGLSRGAAFYRMTAARLLRQHPEVAEPLGDGRLCLTSVVALSKALTAGRIEDVLPRFFGLSTREAKAVTAELVPAATVPSRVVVTAVSAPLPAHAPAPTPNACRHSGPVCSYSDLGQPVGQTNQAPVALAAPRPPGPTLVEEPKTAELSRIHVTVPRRLMQKLEAARAALSHSHPGAGEADILELGLDLLIERHARRRGIVKSPRPPRERPAQPKAQPSEASPHAADGRGDQAIGLDEAPQAVDGGGDRRSEPAAPREARERSEAPAPSVSPRPRREPVPAHVKRAVWLRDGGRCQWPVVGGKICGSTLRVQIDHVVPVALGGRSTVEKLRCLCRAHNDLAARRALGDDLMDRFTNRRRSAAEERPRGA